MLYNSRLLPEDTDFEEVVKTVLDGRLETITA